MPARVRLGRAAGLVLPPPPAPRPRPRRTAPVCFVGTLGDILRGATVLEEAAPPPPRPSLWPFSPPRDPAARRAARRQEKAQRVRAMLAAARSAPRIKLPEPPAGRALHSVSVDSPISVGGPALELQSNALPFAAPPLAPGGAVLVARDGAAVGDELLAPVPPAGEARIVLPWLFAAPGHLDKAAVEALASHLALSRLQVVDLPRMMLAAACAGTRGPWQLAGDVAWVGPCPLPSSATVAAAATLHRLAHRCGGVTAPPGDVNSTAVVLSYRPADAGVAAEALAVYFHLYCGMDAKGAAAAAGATVGSPPPSPSSLAAAVEELAACGRGWLQRVVLEWRYGGASVEVSGEAVGGWDRAAAMAFSVAARRWRLELWGLPPGSYAFKFIVDGHWCVDMAAPTICDAVNNRNNVCMVPACRRRPGGDTPAARAAEAADGMGASPMMLFDGAVRAAGGGAEEEEEEEEEGGGSKEVSPEERLRAARFGAAMLSYYSKSAALMTPARRM